MSVSAVVHFFGAYRTKRTNYLNKVYAFHSFASTRPSFFFSFSSTRIVFTVQLCGFFLLAHRLPFVVVATIL